MQNFLNKKQLHNDWQMKQIIVKIMLSEFVIKVKSIFLERKIGSFLWPKNILRKRNIANMNLYHNLHLQKGLYYMQNTEIIPLEIHIENSALAQS